MDFSKENTIMGDEFSKVKLVRALSPEVIVTITKCHDEMIRKE